MTKTDPTMILIGDIILVDDTLLIKAENLDSSSGMFYVLLSNDTDLPKGERTFSEPVAVLTRQDKTDLRDVLLRGLAASSLA